MSNKFGHLTTLPGGPHRFIALDVETAGKTIGGICPIGLCFVSGTGSLQTYSVLIDTEEPFEPFNTELHGISAETVAGAGTFPTVYVALFDILNTDSLVQHSTFDEKALTSACARYDIPMITSHWTKQRHGCPSGMAHGGHGLANLKKHLGLEFHHHVAGEVARASATVILRAEDVLGMPLSHLSINRQLAFRFEEPSED